MIFAEIVEKGSKWLALSELKRFRHAQIDSETLRKIWIFAQDLTRICQSLVGPSIDFEHIEKNPRFFSFFRFEVLKIEKERVSRVSQAG